MKQATKERTRCEAHPVRTRSLSEREGGLTDEERIEWEKFERMEYLIRAAKVAATARLAAA